MVADRSNARIPPGARSVLAVLWGHTIIGALLIGAAVGLTGLASRPSKPGADAESVAVPGSGITVRTEVADLWVPGTLYELARDQSESPEPLSHEALQLHLKRECIESLWYARTLHLHQLDGRVAEITIVDYPNQPSGDMQDFLDLLDTIGGRPPRTHGATSSSAKVHIIPEDLLKLAPQAAVAELQKRSRDQEKQKLRR